MKIGHNQISQIIKEELQKALQEAYYGKRYGGGYSNKQRTYSSGHPRGGSDEGGPDYFHVPDPTEPKVAPTPVIRDRSKGEDFPKAGPTGKHKYHGFDFARAGNGDYKEGRISLLGDEFADRNTSLRVWKETDPQWADWYLENQKKYEDRDETVDPSFVKWYTDWVARLKAAKAKKQ
jgi:hypothetical protein